jgi:hypothetical protein
MVGVAAVTMLMLFRLTTYAVLVWFAIIGRLANYSSVRKRVGERGNKFATGQAGSRTGKFGQGADHVRCLSSSG